MNMGTSMHLAQDEKQPEATDRQDKEAAGSTQSVATTDAMGDTLDSIPNSQQSVLGTSALGKDKQDPTSTEPPLILRQNEDYLLLCSALEALRGQLDCATSDLQTLEQLRTDALADPMAYVERLKDETGPSAPILQEIVRLPHIEMAKYMQRGMSSSYRPPDGTTWINPLPAFYENTLSSTVRYNAQSVLRGYKARPPSGPSLHSLHRSGSSSYIKGVAASLPPLQDDDDDALSSTPSISGSGDKGEVGIRGKRRRESLAHSSDSDTPYRPSGKRGKSSRHGERRLAVHTRHFPLEAVDDDFVSLKSG
ncbi:hypothetical protein BJ684DRAFT_18640 [Piptocephalis cylindrospora]|uniref:Uncharacterized protein n=1 Tax=Piptocephalis cylindrospora TaxID=1907219 RepID=A0A4V1IYL6_9FUNG|nr:hypothetical protein BJ684DRAFT_18640 [Piptocephalis cylindrospora]|eukprot:RKP14989.1 hypothetical protein BJ684DRAFT_18640 [Piptocephalis cylindrospora]